MPLGLPREQGIGQPLMLVRSLQNFARTFTRCFGVFNVSMPAAHGTSGLVLEGLDTKSTSMRLRKEER